MKLKKYRMPLLICISIIAIIAVAKFSGFDKWIAANTSEGCYSGELCALKLYDQEK